MDDKEFMSEVNKRLQQYSDGNSCLIATSREFSFISYDDLKKVDIKITDTDRFLG